MFVTKTRVNKNSVAIALILIFGGLGYAIYLLATDLNGDIGFRLFASIIVFLFGLNMITMTNFKFKVYDGTLGIKTYPMHYYEYDIKDIKLIKRFPKGSKGKLGDKVHSFAFDGLELVRDKNSIIISPLDEDGLIKAFKENGFTGEVDL